MIKNKLKELLSELIQFKVQSILVLEYKKRNDCKIFHSSAKLIDSDSDIDEAYKSIYKRIMTEIKNSADEGWVVETIVKHRLRFLSVRTRRNNSIEKWR